jgi:hypothetical protein
VEGADFDLDFHAIMHYGEDEVLEEHYVPRRSQRTASVLTFFAQDATSESVVYANADLLKANQARAVIGFCDHWNAVSGADPSLVVFDSKLTTQDVLGELDAPGRALHHPADALARPGYRPGGAPHRGVEAGQPQPPGQLPHPPQDVRGHQRHPQPLPRSHSPARREGARPRQADDHRHQRPGR